MNILFERMAAQMLRGWRAGESRLLINNSALVHLPKSLQLRSAAFEDQAQIPAMHVGSTVGEDLSPQLHWSRLPSDATHWVLIVEDADAPLPSPFVHAIAAGPASVKQLKEGALCAQDRAGRTSSKVALGRNSYGRACYCGPWPLPGHGVHHYTFQLFAVKGPKPIVESRANLLPALVENAIAVGQLTGRFERNFAGDPIDLEP